MSYIVPNEIPKSCLACPYSHVMFKNPLSSTTPVKRFRCQTGKAPWRIIEIDYDDKDYKDKYCPLIAFNVDMVVAQLGIELSLADAEKERCSRENPLQFDSAKGYAHGMANAIKIVRKGGVDDEISNI